MSFGASSQDGELAWGATRRQLQELHERVWSSDDDDDEEDSNDNTDGSDNPEKGENKASEQQQ
eukprot:COSAG05_NODE_5576_length_1136_cov_9.259919_1_plen_62_part_10